MTRKTAFVSAQQVSESIDAGLRPHRLIKIELKFVQVWWLPILQLYERCSVASSVRALELLQAAGDVFQAPYLPRHHINGL